MGNSRGAYLLKTGYSVYRALSPLEPFDLIAYKDETFYRVEVKSANKNKDGYIAFSSPRNNKYDMLIIVGHDNHIFVYTKGTTRNIITKELNLAYNVKEKKMQKAFKVKSYVSVDDWLIENADLD